MTDPNNSYYNRKANNEDDNVSLSSSASASSSSAGPSVHEDEMMNDPTTTSSVGRSFRGLRRTMNNNNNNKTKDTIPVTGKDSAATGTASTMKDSDGISSSAQTMREVRQVKIIIVLVLLISIAGAIAVFFYTKHSEQNEFENQFYDDANKVLGSLLNSMERRFGAFNSLAATIVSDAELTNQTFPFVRIPHYAVHVGRTLQLTNALLTYFNPIVQPDQRLAWEKFASHNNTNIWHYINETIAYQNNFDNFYGPSPEEYNWTFRDSIYSDYSDVPYNSTQDFYLPEWHTFPLVMRFYAPANYDWFPIIDPAVMEGMITSKQASLGRPELIARPEDPVVMETYELWCEFFADFLPPDENCLEPLSYWYYPVVDRINYIDVKSNPKFPEDYEVKAFLNAAIYWKHLVRDILPPNSRGFIIVFDHQQNHDQFTYQIDGPVATFLGGGDLHDPQYNYMQITRNLFDLDSYRIGKSEYFGLPINVNGSNTYTVSVYPSDDMKSNFTTNKPIIFAVSAVAFILFPFLVFLVYDRTLKKQQNEILSTANRSHAIVSSLFPSNVRDQLETFNYNTDAVVDASKTKTYNLTRVLGPPIAELYPETTVLFCDVVNFTQWSSVRDPSQVFTLLESLYGAFDAMASRRNVFKVETIGDCYVAVAGLPELRNDHAEVMARFAHDIFRKMVHVTAELGKSLGPGTSSLLARIGLNSGPTTAGVLRGAKGRFQLFGDTVNTAARMESNSLPGKIMCSQKTADLLIAAGKERWVTPREGLVDAKGKGMMQCYWIHVKPTGAASSVHSTSSDEIFSEELDLEAHSVAWTAEILETLLNEVVAQRSVSHDKSKFSFETFTESLKNPRDEVTETIIIPKNNKTSTYNAPKVHVSETVKRQIYDYVAIIAKMYPNNPFHNFHHATHVVMATQKLLNRVVKPKDGCVSTTAYGITSDPLSQFAIVFSALIHDVDHPGVSNAQLVKEGASLAIRFDNKSVAEQNSVMLAWNLLMDPKFTDFRNLIMATECESRRFRQLIVNSVMATDLFDADLKHLRETRWTKVFNTNNDTTTCNLDVDEDCNRRATIIIEHLIQASDVSHTMQHWHIYQEWNRRLFHEMHKAYLEGRAEKDPSIGWYEGELWFFDNYIIPLAKKLETCGVFGVSCGELLDYARDNRAEWAMKGRDLVTENLRIAREKIFEHQKTSCNTEFSI